ncbi:MAG: hypothetical protein R3F56_21375 [Planctomycetota bacterium]
MRTHSLGFVLLVLLTSPRAQTTWVVDALGRPGTNFTDLPAAVAAAAPGDVIALRYVDPLVSPYQGASISKGLTVVGVGGRPGIVGRLQVGLVPAGQHAVLRNLRLAPFQNGSSTSGDCSLLVRSNSGSVHLQDVDRDATFTFTYPLNQWQVSDNELVTMTECSFPMVSTVSMQVTRVRELVMARCTVAPSNATGFATMQVADSSLILLDSSVVGSVFGAGGSAAISSCDARIHLAGAATRVLGGGGHDAIDGAFGGLCTGLTQLVVGQGAAVGTTNNTATTMASVPALGAFVDDNSRLDTNVAGEPSGFAGLWAGLPAATPVPIFGGTFYLDVAGMLVLPVLGLDAQGHATWQIQLPAIATGSSLWLQGLTVGNGEVGLLTPAVVTMP